MRTRPEAVYLAKQRLLEDILIRLLGLGLKQPEHVVIIDPFPLGKIPPPLDAAVIRAQRNSRHRLVPSGRITLGFLRGPRDLFKCSPDPPPF